MKNNFEIQGERTIIFINRSDGEIIEIIIDTEDLEKVKSFPNSWGATKVGGDRWLIKGVYRENKVKKNITLSRFILDVTDSSPVRFIKGNQLDHRKSNLTVGYQDIQVVKGNEYEIKDDKAYLKIKRRVGSSLTTQIDAEDLQRVLDKSECLSSSQGKITKEDKVKVIYELRQKYSVKALVTFAEIKRSTYYDLVKKMNRPDPDADLKVEIQVIYDEHEGRYGYRRIRDELSNRGQKVNHKKVQRIMKALGLKCIVRMKKYKSYKGTVGKIADNLLNRNFKAEAPNEKWVTDITEFKLFGEKLYLSPVLDLFNGEIITYTIGSRPTYSLVSEMLEKALERLPKEHKLLMHSDQGWHYQMKQYRHSLKTRGIVQSMSRKGNCHDNSVMENFFGIMKSEFLYLKEFENVEQFKEELEKYMTYYNTKRIKAKLKLSPVQYRTQFTQAA